MAEERIEPDDQRAESQRRRERAIAFIRRVRAMDREELHALIVREAGEELARFFLAYATDLMEREPARAVENASSLLLIGYLMRGQEPAPQAEQAEQTEREPEPPGRWLH